MVHRSGRLAQLVLYPSEQTRSKECLGWDKRDILYEYSGSGGSLGPISANNFPREPSRALAHLHASHPAIKCRNQSLPTLAGTS